MAESIPQGACGTYGGYVWRLRGICGLGFSRVFEPKQKCNVGSPIRTNLAGSEPEMLHKHFLAARETPGSQTGSMQSITTAAILGVERGHFTRPFRRTTSQALLAGADAAGDWSPPAAVIR
ncbi:hypothetical protein CDEST_01000 [Colletotrichum destructivum]|uniref:Uncharacterized protein n=1 Tax=Colletotrichum destructivum TaxID=34406 RepID=A0AAX4HYR9_9PEZI|nr:hypothetical protein CDEST_01000 [Colletotrichum destructivum]